MTVGWFTALIFTETSQQVQDGWTDGLGQSSEWIPEMNTDFGVPLILFCSTIMRIIRSKFCFYFGSYYTYKTVLTLPSSSAVFSAT